MPSRRHFVWKATATGLGAASLGALARGPAQMGSDDADEEPYANVKEFGAKGDGSADDTAAILAALASGKVAVVPPGMYRVDGEIAIGTNRHLHVGIGASLVRMPEHSRSQAPVVRLANAFTLLTGEGWIQSGNPSPRGVVCVGPEELTAPTNIGWTRIEGVNIIGSGGEESVGLNLDSAEPSGRGGSNYNGCFSNLQIRDVGTGLQVGEQCNAHTFNSLFFYRIGRYAYRVVGPNYENSYFGGFTHFSAGVTVIKLESAYFNLFYAVQAEPGANSRYFDVDEQSFQCQIIGHDNTPLGGINRSGNLTYLANGSFSIPAVAAAVGHFDSLRSSYDLVQTAPERSDLSSRTYQPIILSAGGSDRIRISGLQRNADAPFAAGLFYEITVAGAAGETDPNVYAARLLATAYVDRNGRPALRMTELGDTSDVEWNVGPSGTTLELRLGGFASNTRGEVVIEIRKVGLNGADPEIRAA